MKIVSRVVPYVVVIVGALTLAALALMFVRSSQIFDGPAPGGLFSIEVSMTGGGPSRSAAIAASEAARVRAFAVFARQGFQSRDAVVDEALRSYAVRRYPPEFRADQSFDVRWPTYAKLARLSNAADRLKDPAIAGGFPDIAFSPFAITIGVVYIFLLMLSGIALETREDDVSHAPRGMHPLLLAVQTLFLGCSIALAVVYARVLADAAVSPFILLCALGVLSLGYWLWKTRSWWNQSRLLRVAWVAYVCALALAVAADAVALAQPLT
jgi:hypothetical protein